jgi:hypothetical protein
MERHIQIITCKLDEKEMKSGKIRGAATLYISLASSLEFCHCLSPSDIGTIEAFKQASLPR